MYSTIKDLYSSKLPTSHLTTTNNDNDIRTTTNPKIWGPPFWKSLHLSATHYPENPTLIVKHHMKNRILAIPYEIPCNKCRIHALHFIEKHMDYLDQIVSNKHSLGKFYVDFHNQVNQRYNKPTWTYEQAYAYYQNPNNFV